jgi:hypothetical protein
MANIQVKDLTRSSIAGFDLFNDLESFIQDLSEPELNLQGGFGTPLSHIIITFAPE